MGIKVQVANTSDDAWRWRKVKQKDDRRDALKAARLAAVNQLREVYIPAKEVRQWRALITYRQQLVRRRTKIKNHIRDLFAARRAALKARQRLLEPAGHKTAGGAGPALQRLWASGVM